MIAVRAYADDLGLGGGDRGARLLRVQVVGLEQLDPEQAADSATGGTLRPRPRGRSGRVTTSSGRCGVGREPVEHVGETRTCRGRPVRIAR